MFRKYSRVISAVVLSFFTWTSGGVFSVAHAAVDVAKGKAADVAKKKAEGPEERFARLTGELEETLVNAKTDVAAKRKHLQERKGEMDALDVDKQYYQQTKGGCLIMVTNFTVQHKIYIKLLVAIIFVYILAVCLGFYFADNKQYVLFIVMIFVIIGNVNLGRYYAKKLNQQISISEDGVKLCVPDLTNIFDIKSIAADLKWEEIERVVLLDDNKGPIIIETCKGNFSFWHPFDNKINLQIIKLINKKD